MWGADKTVGGFALISVTQSLQTGSSAGRRTLIYKCGRFIYQIASAQCTVGPIQMGF